MVIPRLGADSRGMARIRRYARVALALAVLSSAFLVTAASDCPGQQQESLGLPAISPEDPVAEQYICLDQRRKCNTYAVDGIDVESHYNVRLSFLPTKFYQFHLTLETVQAANATSDVGPSSVEFGHERVILPFSRSNANGGRELLDTHMESLNPVRTTKDVEYRLHVCCEKFDGDVPAEGPKDSDNCAHASKNCVRFDVIIQQVLWNTMEVDILPMILVIVGIVFLANSFAFIRYKRYMRRYGNTNSYTAYMFTMSSTDSMQRPITGTADSAQTTSTVESLAPVQDSQGAQDANP